MAGDEVASPIHGSERVDPHLARILAVQLLAQLDVQGDSFLPQMAAFLARSDLAPNVATQARASELVRRVWFGRKQLDRQITATAERWSVDRMSPVDRNVIRVALAELAEGTVPPKVVINEAIEISKEYSSAESARFVNGLLDAMYKGALRAQAGEDTE